MYLRKVSKNGVVSLEEIPQERYMEGDYQLCKTGGEPNDVIVCQYASGSYGGGWYALGRTWEHFKSYRSAKKALLEKLSLEEVEERMKESVKSIRTYYLAVTWQNLDDIVTGISCKLDQMTHSELSEMGDRFEALEKKILRKLKRIRQKEDEK